MSELSRADVCAKYGLADRELVSFDESPGGLIFATSDGNSYIEVPEDLPDFDGKTGLMFLHAPNVDGGRGYTGDFPVYVSTPDPAGDVEGGAELEDLSALTNAQLIAHGAALDPPVVLDKKLNKTQLLTALADAAAAAVEAAGGVEGGAE